MFTELSNSISHQLKQEVQVCLHFIHNFNPTLCIQLFQGGIDFCRQLQQLFQGIQQCRADEEKWSIISYCQNIGCTKVGRMLDADCFSQKQSSNSDITGLKICMAYVYHLTQKMQKHLDMYSLNGQVMHASASNPTTILLAHSELDFSLFHQLWLHTVIVLSFLMHEVISGQDRLKTGTQCLQLHKNSKNHQMKT